MARWNVHYEVTLTYDTEIDADSYEEALDIAENKYGNINYSQMNYDDR